jgi:hypothetical protein
MKLSSLSNLLRKELSPEIFLSEFIPEFSDYENKLDIKGSSITLDVIEDEKIIISVSDIKKLCELFIENKLNNNHLCFIADALQLCDLVDFKEEEVSDYVDELTDPEINGVFTKERAIEIVEKFT